MEIIPENRSCNKTIVLERGQTNLFLSPRTKRLLPSKHAALEWCQREGWQGVVTTRFNLTTPLRWMGFDLVWAHSDRQTGTLQQKIEELRTVSSKQVLRNYRRERARGLTYPDEGRSPLYDYYYSDAVAETLARKVHRDLFATLALRTSEFPADEAIDIFVQPTWPELLLCREDEIKLVTVIPGFQRHEDLREHRRYLLEEICEPLGITTDTITIVPAQEHKEFVPIQEQSVAIKVGPAKKLGTGREIDTWISPLTGTAMRIEEAMLDSYRKQGWSGCWSEYGIVEALLDCAGLACGPANSAKARKKIDLVSVEFITRKFKMKWRRYGELYPSVTEAAITALYGFLGPERTLHIAANFEQAGWPDLMVYKRDDLMFVEVKSPRDKLSESQERIMYNVLRPIGVKCQIARVMLRRS